MVGLAGAPPAELVDTRFPATEAAVARQIDAIAAAVDGHRLGRRFRTDIAIVLGEVLNNIVEHSLAGRRGASIELSVRVEGCALLVETVDRGRPLPPRLLLGAELPDSEVAVPDLPEGGFGWFIIHALAQDMVYERAAGANRLSFRLAAQA